MIFNSKKQQKRSSKKGTIALGIVGALSALAGSYAAGNKQVGKGMASKVIETIKSSKNKIEQTNSNEE